MSNLESLLKQHSNLISTEKFSRFLFTKNYLAQYIIVPAQDALSLYSEIAKCNMLNQKKNDFIQTGLRIQKENIKNKRESVNLNAFAIFNLRTALCEINIPAPYWLPDVFRSEASDLVNYSHKNLFLLNWSTVTPSTIPTCFHNILELAILTITSKGYPDNNCTQVQSKKINTENPEASESQSGPQDKSVASNSHSGKQDSKSLSGPQDESTSSKLDALKSFSSSGKANKEVTSKPIDSDAKRDLYVANLYLSLHKQSIEEHKNFSLSFSELNEALSTEQCHYTGTAIECNTEKKPLNRSSAIFNSDAECFSAEAIVICSESIALLLLSHGKETRKKILDAIDTFQSIGVKKEKLINILSEQKEY